MIDSPAAMFPVTSAHVPPRPRHTRVLSKPLRYAAEEVSLGQIALIYPAHGGSPQRWIWILHQVSRRVKPVFDTSPSSHPKTEHSRGDAGTVLAQALFVQASQWSGGRAYCYATSWLAIVFSLRALYYAADPAQSQQRKPCPPLSSFQQYPSRYAVNPSRRHF